MNLKFVKKDHGSGPLASTSDIITKKRPILEKSFFTERNCKFIGIFDSAVVTYSMLRHRWFTIDRAANFSTHSAVTTCKILPESSIDQNANSLDRVVPSNVRGCLDLFSFEILKPSVWNRSRPPVHKGVPQRKQITPRLMDISWIFKKFAAVPVERSQRSHLFILLFFQSLHSCFPLSRLYHPLSLSSSYSKWREWKGSRNFFQETFKTPIILIRDYYYFLFRSFFLFFQRRLSNDIRDKMATWRGDGRGGASWTKLETMWRRHTGSPARFIRARRTQKAFHFFA